MFQLLVYYLKLGLIVMHACYLIFSEIVKIRILILSLILICRMSKFVMLRFKWLCDDIDLDVENKDKVTLLVLIMNWKD